MIRLCENDLVIVQNGVRGFYPVACVLNYAVAIVLYWWTTTAAIADVFELVRIDFMLYVIMFTVLNCDDS